MGIFQARILEWVAISSPGDLPHPGIKPEVPGAPAAPALQVDSLPAELSGNPKFTQPLSGRAGLQIWTI